MLTAARKHAGGKMAEPLAKYEAGLDAADPLSPFRETLAGGDVERGRRVFFEKTEVSCVRCHKIGGQGGEVGPDLSALGGTKPIEYLLEAIALPNKVVAENFESVTVFDLEGRVHSGVLKLRNEQEVRLITPEGDLKIIPMSEVDEILPGKSAMPEDLVHETAPPLIVLDFSKRRQMTIHWGPNPENGRNNALPEGTRGAKLFCHIGGIPADENDWVWLADDTRSPYIHLLNNSAPLTIAYRAQYFDRRMNTGPFGDPVVATISA